MRLFKGAVKIIGASGQISLGKKYAGQTVLIENMEEGVMITAGQAIEEMQKLHSCLCWTDGRSNPKRMLEELRPLQAQIISALGFESGGGVLQEKKS